MDKRLDENLVQQMSAVLHKQVSEFEAEQKTKKRNAEIVAGEGSKKWIELKNLLKSYVEKINESFSDPLLSFSDNVGGNELSLRHELRDRDVQVAFDAASAVISYQGGKGKGEFRPRIQGDSLEYGWDEIARCYGIEPSRMIRFEEDADPMPFPTERMSEIILRCLVLD